MCQPDYNRIKVCREAPIFRSFRGEDLSSWYRGSVKSQNHAGDVLRFAEMFGALSAEPRLHILRLLLSAYPQGLIVSDIQSELGIPGSTLSHHLDKLKSQDLVTVRRDVRCLWYTANADVLEELLRFLFDECCSRSKVVKGEFKLCK